MDKADETLYKSRENYIGCFNHIKIEQLIKEEALCHTIVCTPVEDALRRGFYTDEDNNSEFEDFLDRYGVLSVIDQAFKYARYYGYCNVAVDVNDSGDWKDELKNGDHKLKYLHILGKSKTLQIDNKSFEVHESRLLKFYGIDLLTYDTNNNDDTRYISVLEPMKGIIKTYSLLFGSVRKKLDDNNSLVVYIDGFREALTGQKGSKNKYKQLITDQFSEIMKKRLTGEPILLDGKDKAGVVENNSDFEKLHEMVMINIAMSSSIPVVKLFKTSPKNFIANDYDIKNYNAEVEKHIASQVVPNLRKLLAMVGKLWTIKHNTFEEITEKDKLTYESMILQNAQTLQMLFGDMSIVKEYLLKNEMELNSLKNFKEDLELSDTDIEEDTADEQQDIT